MKNPVKQFETVLDNNNVLTQDQLEDCLVYFEKKDIKLEVLLADYIRDKVVDYTGKESLNSVMIALDYLDALVERIDIDKELLSKKAKAISQRIDTKIMDEKKKFVNPEQTIKRLDEVQTRMDDIYYKALEELSLYDLLTIAIDRNDYGVIESAFINYPSIVNEKNAVGRTVYSHVIEQALNSIGRLDENDYIYYASIIDLIRDSESFRPSKDEIDYIKKEIADFENRISLIHGKKNRKETRRLFDNLKDRVRSSKETEETFESVCKKHFIVPACPKGIETNDKIYLPGDDYNRTTNDEYTVSIDKKVGMGPLDDAMSCVRLPNGNYLLQIHTTDPLGYYDFDSDIIQAALRRKSVIMFPHGYNYGSEKYHSYEILPESFSMGVASLDEEKNRFSRTYTYEISRDGKEYEDLGMTKTITEVSKNTTNVNSARILSGELYDEELTEALYNISNALIMINHIRKFSNTIDNLNPSNPAYIAECVKISQNLVNYSNGVKLSKLGAPGPYRVFERSKDQDLATSRLLSELKEEYGTGQSNMFNTAHLATSGIHEEMGGPYVYATSPLREAESIMVNRCQDLYLYDSTPEEKEDYNQEVLRFIKDYSQKRINNDRFKSHVKKLS